MYFTLAFAVVFQITGSVTITTPYFSAVTIISYSSGAAANGLALEDILHGRVVCVQCTSGTAVAISVAGDRASLLLGLGAILAVCIPIQTRRNR